MSAAPPPVGRYYLDLVMRRWRPVVAIVATCTLVAWAVTVFLLAQFPKFEGAARLNIVPTSEELGYASRFVRGSTFDGGSVLLQTYGEYAHTRPIVAPIVDRYIRERARAEGLTVAQWAAANAQPSPFAPGPWISWLQYGATPPRPPRETLIDKLVQNTTLETVEGTYLLRVAVDWSDPVSAAWLANRLSDSIVDQADAMSHQTGTQIAGGLESRLAETRATLAAKLRQSRALKNRLGVVDIDRQKQSLLEERLAQQAQLTTDRSDLSAARARVAGLQARAGGKLSVTQLQIQQSLATETPRLDGIARGIPVREARIAAIGAQLDTLGRNEQAVKQLDDDADVLATQVKSLEERVSFSQTENLANAPRIRLIERAVPPPVRISPKALFNTVLGFLAGCALAGCWLLLFDMGEARATAPARQAAAAGHPPVDPAPTMSEPEPLVVAEPRDADEDAPVTIIAAPRPIAAGGEGGMPRPLSRTPRASCERLFPGRLRPPTDGVAYDAAEAAGIGALIADWLALPLADPARPLVVVSAGEDREAQILYRLLHGHLRATGQPVRTVDGTLRPVTPPDGTGPRALVYGGGFAGSARLELLSEIDADIVIAVTASGDRARAMLAALQRSVQDLAGRLPYVVALGG